MNNSMHKYDGLAQLLHWLVAVLVVAQFVLIWGRHLAETRETMGMMVQLHKSTGMTILLLAIVRLGWRLRYAPPAYSAEVHPLERRFAPMFHWLLYVFLFAMPITGWMMSSAGGRGTHWYWLFEFPRLIGEHEGWKEILNTTHIALGWALFVLASLHVLAGLWHLFIRKDGVMQRMLP